MSRRSHGSQYDGMRTATFSKRSWERMQAAQRRFAEEAFTLGKADAEAGHPMRINMSVHYSDGYRAATATAA